MAIRLGMKCSTATPPTPRRCRRSSRKSRANTASPNASGSGTRLRVRGNVSAANLEFIRQRGGQYIVGTPKAMLRQVQGELTKEGWQQVREGIQVKVIQHAGDEQETFVLCRSQDWIGKEVGMLEKFAA